MSQPLLELENLRAGYASSTVLDGISFSLNPGDSLALLGRNGVGKSTLLTSCMGLTRQHSGRILWQGEDISTAPTSQRAHLGLGWVPQERLVFASLTVDEHLSSVARPGPWTADRVYQLFPSLSERKKNRGLQLSGGEQQMLALGRALVTNPRLLLLDEPMEGLAPVIVQQLVQVLRELIAQDSLAIILAEQHAQLALSLTEKVIVLDRGRIVHQGLSSQLKANPSTLNQLLGVNSQGASSQGASSAYILEPSS